MNIGLDFDGVVVDIVKLKRHLLQAEYNVQVSPGKVRKKILVGDYVTVSQYKNIQELVFECSDHNVKLEFVQGASEHMRRLLRDGHTLRVVTARHRKSSRLALEWLELQDFDLDFTTVAGGRNKAGAAQGLDVFVDDDLDKLESLQGIVPHLFLFDWPYNQDEDASGIAERVGSWSDLYMRVSAIQAAHSLRG